VTPAFRSDGALCVEAVSLQSIADAVRHALLCLLQSRAPERLGRFRFGLAAMNDLTRPALYEAWHDIVPVQPRSGTPQPYDVVGPVCESDDFLGPERSLSVQPGDLLAILSAGAYGMSMSSNYNTRPRAAEVMIDGAAAHLVRARESVESLFALERVLP